MDKKIKNAIYNSLFSNSYFSNKSFTELMRIIEINIKDSSFYLKCCYIDVADGDNILFGFKEISLTILEKDYDFLDKKRSENVIKGILKTIIDNMNVNHLIEFKVKK